MKCIPLWPLLFLMISMQADMHAQSTKKREITDWIGGLVGVNEILYYPKDINGNPIRGGNPILIPDVMYGLSYHHTFSKRWSHLFQFRIANHQIKYWKYSDQTWHVDGERVIVKSDTGQYHLKYQDVCMNYMFGWTISKKTHWNIYTGMQISYTVDNQSTKTVDRYETGKLNGFNYIPYPEPRYFYNETLKTYSPDAEAFVLFRTDCGINLAKQWRLRPVLEFGLDIGGIYNHTNRYVAFYLELYKDL